MARRAFTCSICNNINLPSACVACINSRLLETYKAFKNLSRRQDALRLQVEACLETKHEADQHHWSITHKDRINKLKEKLQKAEDELRKGKEKLTIKRQIQEAQSHSLAKAKAQLAKKQVEQLRQHQLDLVRTHSLQLTNITSELQQWRRFIFCLLCKVFPLKHKSSASVGGSVGTSQLWTICGINLPDGDNPHSVSKQELEASLGCLFQLLQLAANFLCAPLLHAGRFRCSSSKIWQRSSYWDATPSNSGEYLLFIAAHDRGLSEEHSFADKGTSIMGFSTIESFTEERLGDGHSSSTRYGSSSMHSPEMHSEVQKAIKLLKRSVACVSSYGFNELLSSMPSNTATYQAFAELMALLSSKEIKLRITQHQISLADSALSTASTLDTCHAKRDHKDFKVRIRGSSNINSSFYCIGKDSDYTENKAGESTLDEWDMVEHITFPPPPSNAEDVEHWTRAMFVDARK